MQRFSDSAYQDKRLQPAWHELEILRKSFGIKKITALPFDAENTKNLECRLQNIVLLIRPIRNSK